jgi:hypothetical protein
MFTKHVSQIEYDDIVDLVNVRKEREGYNLDYKADIGNPDKAKKELSKDISAFANSSGGYLILGIDKNYDFVGIEDTIQSKSTDEWINQILSSNIEPPVFYFDPRIIHLSESKKVIVVIHVPESTRKPHIVREWNKYYIRVNDSSKSANHIQIRDMFEMSKRRTDEFNEFIVKKNLYDDDSPEFGQNLNSKQLLCDIKSIIKKPIPLILFSLFPKYPNDEKIHLSFQNFHSWLQGKSEGYEPCPDIPLFLGSYYYDLRMDGVVLKNMMGTDMSSYFEILNNGYIEAGFSSSFTFVYTNPFFNTPYAAINLTQIIIYEMKLLGFAREFYDLAKYYDEVLIQLSFVNLLEYIPFVFEAKSNPTWRSNPPSNKQHNSFKLTYRFNPKTLTDNEILTISKFHSERLCRAFGLAKDYCFIGDKPIISEMRGFHL